MLRIPLNLQNATIILEHHYKNFNALCWFSDHSGGINTQSTLIPAIVFNPRLGVVPTLAIAVIKLTGEQSDFWGMGGG